ncbi:MAG TPA: GntR family transcriptional regulator [Gaiellaceae bacterium]|nr:GntR family transcriptional regulator [Gaiellaceae bacterium]
MALIEFHLDSRSGVPTYLQLVQQVRHAVQLGILTPGDQLPTVKEVVAGLAINPNTVLKAYGVLESEGIAEGRRGQGTFVKSSAPAPLGDDLGRLRRSLRDWFGRARAAGLDEQAIEALLSEQRASGSARRVA